MFIIYSNPLNVGMAFGCAVCPLPLPTLDFACYRWNQCNVNAWLVPGTYHE